MLVLNLDQIRRNHFFFVRLKKLHVMSPHKLRNIPCFVSKFSSQKTRNLFFFFFDYDYLLCQSTRFDEYKDIYDLS